MPPAENNFYRIIYSMLYKLRQYFRTDGCNISHQEAIYDVILKYREMRGWDGHAPFFPPGTAGPVPTSWGKPACPLKQLFICPLSKRRYPQNSSNRKRKSKSNASIVCREKWPALPASHRSLTRPPGKMRNILRYTVSILLKKSS